MTTPQAVPTTTRLPERATCSVRDWVYRNVPPLFDRLPESLPPADLATSFHFPRTLQAIGDLQAAWNDSRREALQTEQVSLFVNAAGGVPAPPYASWYLDGYLLGPGSEWAKQQYRHQALDVATDAGEPADFLATELEYLYFLSRHEAAAITTRDGDALEQVRLLQLEFFQAHFDLWIPLFVTALRNANPGPAFSRVADLLEAFQAEESWRISHI